MAVRVDPLAKSYAFALGVALAEAGARRGGGAREWSAEPPRQRESAGANTDERPLSSLAVHLAIHRATAEVWPSQPCIVRSPCRDQYVS